MMWLCMLLALAAPLLPPRTVLAFTPAGAARPWKASALLLHSGNGDESPILTSREPQQLSRGTGRGRATFLGFRNVKDLRRDGTLGALGGNDSPSLLRQSARPLYPEGGLSPCVIRVLGVGGGGCNAVRVSA